MAYELTAQEATQLKQLLLKVNLGLLDSQQSADQLEWAAMTMLNYAHALRRQRGLAPVPPVATPPVDDATAPINSETLHAA